MRNGARYGARAAILGFAGRFASFVLLFMAVAIGLGTLIAASETALTVIKWCEVAYLPWLGVQTLRANRKHAATGHRDADQAHGQAVETRTSRPPSVARVARQEFPTSITNPKALLLVSAFLPPVRRSRPGSDMAAHRLRRGLRRAGVRRRLWVGVAGKQDGRRTACAGFAPRSLVNDLVRVRASEVVAVKVSVSETVPSWGFVSSHTDTPTTRRREGIRSIERVGVADRAQERTAGATRGRPPLAMGRSRGLPRPPWCSTQTAARIDLEPVAQLDTSSTERLPTEMAMIDLTGVSHRAGQESTMYKVTVLYGHPTDPEAFDAHYRDMHVAMAKSLPGLVGCTLHRPEPGPDGAAPSYYLVVEFSVPSREAMQTIFNSPEGQAGMADVPKFATGGVTFLFGPEEVVLPSRS